MMASVTDVTVNRQKPLIFNRSRRVVRCGMVLLGRIELPTSALPRMRSTTELQQHTIPPDVRRCRWGTGDRGALLAVRPCIVKRLAR